MINSQEIYDRVIEKIDISDVSSNSDIEKIIIKILREELRNKYIPVYEYIELIHELASGFTKLDMLQDLIDDSNITEVMINGPNNIFVEEEGKISKSDLTIRSQRKLEDIIQQMVSDVNKSVNTSTPIVDARLEDGSRINIVLPPIAVNGPIVTIRKFPSVRIVMEDLIKIGSLDKNVAEFLKILVQARYNIFISGGTGSGKTTFLNVLSDFIPTDERIIVIEDNVELQITNIPNIVRLEARQSNTEGEGEITIRDLIKSSLRMRPDRIIVGEVRSDEAVDMLQAMNTGHDGSISTGHGNSPLDMLARLETMILMGTEIPLSAVQRQLASGIDIIIHLGRLRDKSRKVMEITEVVGYQDGQIILNPLYKFKEEGNTSAKDKVIGKLYKVGEIQNQFKLKNSGLSY